MCSSLNVKYMELTKDLANCLASYRKDVVSWCITDHSTELRVRYYVNSNKEENLCIHIIPKVERILTVEEFRMMVDNAIKTINNIQEKNNEQS